MMSDSPCQSSDKQGGRKSALPRTTRRRHRSQTLREPSPHPTGARCCAATHAQEQHWMMSTVDPISLYAPPTVASSGSLSTGAPLAFRAMISCAIATCLPCGAAGEKGGVSIASAQRNGGGGGKGTTRAKRQKEMVVRGQTDGRTAAPRRARTRAPCRSPRARCARPCARTRSRPCRGRERVQQKRESAAKPLTPSVTVGRRHLAKTAHRAHHAVRTVRLIVRAWGSRTG